jgi:hypothetical protein
MRASRSPLLERGKIERYFSAKAMILGVVLGYVRREARPVAMRCDRSLSGLDSHFLLRPHVRLGVLFSRPWWTE